MIYTVGDIKKELEQFKDTDPIRVSVLGIWKIRVVVKQPAFDNTHIPPEPINYAILSLE